VSNVVTCCTSTVLYTGNGREAMLVYTDTDAEHSPADSCHSLLSCIISSAHTDIIIIRAHVATDTLFMHVENETETKRTTIS